MRVLNLVSRMRLRLVCLLEGKKKQAKTVTISFGASKDSLSEVSTITYCLESYVVLRWQRMVDIIES